MILTINITEPNKRKKVIKITLSSITLTEIRKLFDIEQKLNSLPSDARWNLDISQNDE